MKKKQQKAAAEKRLLCDFAYSTPYPDDAGDGRRFIHAYSAQAEERKHKFLEDARALLKAVGRELEAYGFDRADVRVNPSGIAGSGDASADYRRPDSPRWLHVHVSETCVDILGEAPPLGTYPTTVAFTTRKDGICVMARWHDPPPKPNYSAVFGPNTWLDANLSSARLAGELVKLVGLEPAPAAEDAQGLLFAV
jgi:hypothetical protein